MTAQRLMLTTGKANAIPLKGVGSNGESSRFAIGVEGENPGRSGLWLGALISGEEPARIVFDPRPLPMAPNFEKTGYKPTFFTSQQQDYSEEEDARSSPPGKRTPAAKI